MDNMLKFVARIAAALLATFALVGCIDIDIDPDAGDEDGSTTTDPSGTGDETEDTTGDTTDESTDESSDGVPMDLPSDETTEESTDESETGDEPEPVCCTCDEEPECQPWRGMSVDQCEVVLAGTLNEETHWCLLDQDDLPTDCVAACESVEDGTETGSP
jgi:hypothetical protein